MKREGGYVLVSYRQDGLAWGGGHVHKFDSNEEVGGRRDVVACFGGAVG